MEIKDYPNYLIFKNGAVLSKGFDKFHPPRFLKHNINTQTGYYYVNLYKDKKAKPHYIHRLLGLHYIDNPENKKYIDHIDRNKLNNKLCNLRWVTASENNYNKDEYKVSNKTGYKGIYYSKKENRYRYKNKRYKTLEEAVEVFKRSDYI